MKGLWIFAVCCILLLSTVYASQTYPPGNSVSICDPANPLNCLGPSSFGAIAGAVTGGVTGGSPVGIIEANTSIAISQSTTALAQIIALSSGQRIYITSYDIVASGGANSVEFEYGTGTNCGTGTTALTGANSYPANGGTSRGSGLGPILIVPSGNALCMTLGSAISVTGSMSFAQF